MPCLTTAILQWGRRLFSAKSQQQAKNAASDAGNVEVGALIGLAEALVGCEGVMRVYDGQGCLIIRQVRFARCPWWLSSVIHLLFGSCYTEPRSAWNFPVYFVAYPFGACDSFVFELPFGSQRCVNGQCPILLGF